MRATRFDPVSFSLGKQEGGGGTTDYNALSNKPSIGGVTLTGDKTAADFGLATVVDLSGYVQKDGAKVLSDNNYTTAEKNAVATIGDKVDKVAGKGLSTEDYTSAEKDKLSGIEAGANKTLIDDTLSNAGQAADAKETGDKIAALESQNALMRELIDGIDAPIYRTASGNPATFADGYAANLKYVTVTITPTQSGSGDPSPDNVRPISGVSSVSVTRTGENGANAQTVTVTLSDGSNPLTVYGGTLDVTTGELTLTQGSITFDGSQELRRYGNTVDDADVNTFRFFYPMIPIPNLRLSESDTARSNILCDTYTVCAASDLFNRAVSSGIALAKYTGWGFQNTLIIRDTAFSDKTASDFQSYLEQHPVTVVYELASPVTYQLTPAQLATLSGYNSVSTDAGTLSVTYRADPTITLGGD